MRESYRSSSQETRLNPAPAEVKQNHLRLKNMAGQIREWDPEVSPELPPEKIDRICEEAGVKPLTMDVINRIREAFKGLPDEELQEEIRTRYEEWATERSNAVLNWQMGELSKPSGLTSAELYMLQPKYLNIPETQFRQFEQVALRKLAQHGVARPALEAYGKGNDLSNLDVKRRVGDLVTIDSMAYNQLLRVELAKVLAEAVGVEDVTKLREKFPNIVPAHWKKAEGLAEITADEVRRKPAAQKQRPAANAL